MDCREFANASVFTTEFTNAGVFTTEFTNAWVFTTADNCTLHVCVTMIIF